MNKEYNFSNFLKKHWIIILILLVIPITLFCCIFLSDSLQLNESDWITFLGAILTYAGTVLVSIVALFQSDKATHLSKKVYELSEREHHAIFVVERVEDVDIEQCSNVSGVDKIHFCYVDLTPSHCKGYRIKIKNCGNYPITHILISTTYHIGRNRVEETLSKEIDTVIASNESCEYLLCNTPAFSTFNGNVIFALKCTNLYGYFMEQEIKICHVNSDKTVQYLCKIMDTASK